MKNAVSYFLLKLAIFSIFLAIMLFFAAGKFQISNIIWFGYGYLVILSAVSYLIAYSGLKKDNKTFLTRIYGSIGIRFVFSIFPLIIYLIFSNIKDIYGIIAYVLIYFFLTSFEIYHLVINLRPELKRN